MNVCRLVHTSVGTYGGLFLKFHLFILCLYMCGDIFVLVCVMSEDNLWELVSSSSIWVQIASGKYLHLLSQFHGFSVFVCFDFLLLGI